MKLLRHATLLTLLALAAGVAAAQRTPGFEPMVCGPDADMELKCLDACIICDIDGFTGRNDNGGRRDEGDMPQGFCTTINHNIQWIGFLATDSELTLRLTVTDCEDGRADGLEAGVYYVEECDRAGATAVATCNSDIANGTATDFAMDDLVAGQYYYFVIDGNDGGICDYRIDVVDGSTRVPDLAFRQNEPVAGPRQVCPGGTYTYTGEEVDGAPVASWTLDGAAVGGSSRERTRDITFPDVDYGVVEVCYTARNLCNQVEHCFDVVVGDPGTTVDVPLCYGESRTIDGETFDAEGDFAVARTNAAGCDSVVTYRVRVGEELTGTQTLPICTGGSVTVQGVTYTTDAAFDAVYTASTGCDSVVATTVVVAPPPPETRPVVLCDGASATRDGFAFTAADTAAPRREVLTTEGGCALDVTYVVSVAPHTDDTVAYRFCTGEPLEIDGVTFPRPGYYPQPIVRASTGCDSAVTLAVVVEDCPFEGEATAAPARCAGGADGSLTVAVVGDYPPYTAELRRGGAALGDPVAAQSASFTHTFTDLPAGAYEVFVTDANGATGTFGATVGEPAPLAVDISGPAEQALRATNGGYDLACAGDASGGLVAAARGGIAPYAYRWADGALDSARTGLVAGDYAVVATDAHGCTATAARALTEPAPLAVSAQPFDRGCGEAEPGGIALVDLAGGVPPYRYRLDGQADAQALPAAGTTISPVAPGRHDLVVLDANGCATERTAAVGSLRPAEVSAGPDLTILRGESAELQAESAQADTRLAWEALDPLAADPTCATCPRPTVQPDTTTRYRVTAVNADGCAATAAQLVRVEIDRRLWAPNAISPNGDDRNEGFTVYASDAGSVIEELRVFDRWGNAVFQTTDVETNDPRLGWDGRYDDERLNSAVFVYWARVRASDGETQLVSGDVTVMR